MLRLLDSHYRYVTAVVEKLVAEGISRGEMKSIDPRIAAAVLAGAGEFLTRPEVGAHVDRPVAEVVSAAVDLVLDGLAVEQAAGG